MYYLNDYPISTVVPRIYRNEENVIDVRPPVNVEEFGDHYEISVEMPGIKKDQITVEIEKGYLNITGKRNNEELPEGATRIYSERGQGDFKRSFRMGRNINMDSVKAELRDGILTLTIQKSAEQLKKLIEIKG